MLFPSSSEGGDSNDGGDIIDDDIIDDDSNNESYSRSSTSPPLPGLHGHPQRGLASRVDGHTDNATRHLTRAIGDDSGDDDDVRNMLVIVMNSAVGWYDVDNAEA